MSQANFVSRWLAGWRARSAELASKYGTANRPLEEAANRAKNTRRNDNDFKLA
jgi:hypothetical protein